MRRILPILGFALLAIAIGGLAREANDHYRLFQWTVYHAPSGSSPDVLTEPTEEEPLPTPLPSRVFIDMAFAAQAPHGNWGMPYQEACEEASLLLVHHYLEGTPLTPDIMDKEIHALVEREKEEFGFLADMTIEQVAEMAEKLYDDDATVLYDPTMEEIKGELAKGNPLVAPFAGRDLKNPYYTGEGPWYHMLVIVGFDSSHFITNDVGTRRGEGYRYPYKRLYDAIHNWTGVKEDIRSGRKAVLILHRS